MAHGCRVFSATVSFEFLVLNLFWFLRVNEETLNLFGVEITGIDFGLLLGNLATLAKIFHSDTKTKSIQDDRVLSKKSYDERFAEYDVRMGNVERRLDKGDMRFSNVEKKIDENFRDMKNDFSKIGGNVKFIMGLLKGIDQENRKKK
ncbi:MAG: hypothetical protein J6U57_05725 [Bacteroidales bacterium]|nr:hypothetical protein [Bacteroidales bacterium]